MMIGRRDVVLGAAASLLPSDPVRRAWASALALLDAEGLVDHNPPNWPGSTSRRWDHCGLNICHILDVPPVKNESSFETDASMRRLIGLDNCLAIWSDESHVSLTFWNRERLEVIWFFPGPWETRLYRLA